MQRINILYIIIILSILFILLSYRKNIQSSVREYFDTTIQNTIFNTAKIYNVDDELIVKNINVKNNVTVENDITAKKNININNDVNIMNNLTAKNKTNLNNLTVAGIAQFNGDVNVNKDKSLTSDNINVYEIYSSEKTYTVPSWIDDKWIDVIKWIDVKWIDDIKWINVKPNLTISNKIDIKGTSNLKSNFTLRKSKITKREPNFLPGSTSRAVLHWE